MCWRDDEPSYRSCSFCGNKYYGDLGHRNCPGWTKTDPAPQESMRSSEKLASEDIVDMDDPPF